MLVVGEEDGPGYPLLCMVCALEKTELNERLFVVLWERDMAPVVGAARQQDPRFLGGCLRLCHDHLDELAILIAEVL